MEQAFTNFKHGYLMRGIYAQESSMGIYDGCKAKGLVNGFGFMQSTAMWKCFNNFHEVAQQVDSWLDDHLAYETVNQALCLYNKGLKLDNCDYAIKVLDLSR